MSDPVTAALMVAAAVAQGVGEISSGAGKAAAYQANSRAAYQQATVARQQSYLKSAQIERQVAESGGKNQAAFGLAGVSPSLWLVSDAAHQGALAKAKALYEGQAEASQQQREGDIQHAQATAARTGSYIGAATTLLGTAAQIAGGAFKPTAPSDEFVLGIPTDEKIASANAFDPSQLWANPARLQ